MTATKSAAIWSWSIATVAVRSCLNGAQKLRLATLHRLLREAEVAREEFTDAL